MLVEAHERLDHARRHLRIHREVFAGPVGGRPKAPHLAGDGIAREFLPIPDFADERLTPEVMAGEFLRVELPLDTDLGCDACMVGTRHEHGVVAQHPVVANEAVHDRLVERMTHVQGAGDVGRGKLDHIGLARGAWRVDVLACREIATLLPRLVPAGFEVGRFETLGKFALWGAG